MNQPLRLSLLICSLLLTSLCGALEITESNTSGVLIVREDTSDVLVYRYADTLPSGVDPKYVRSSYIEQLYDLQGQPLLDDFPADHPHHHGIFWAWPAVEVRGKKTQNWHPAIPSLRHHFVRWTERKTDASSAIFTAEIQWLLDEKEVVAREWATVTVHSATTSSRAIDIDIKIEAVGGPLTLAGTTEGNKGYGGFCMRAAPDFKGAALLTDKGASEKDIVGQPTMWADIATSSHGIAIFAAPDYPTYPPDFMARISYAGFINISWPGLAPVVLLPGKPVTLHNRVLIHDSDFSQESLQQAYSRYASGQSR